MKGKQFGIKRIRLKAIGAKLKVISLYFIKRYTIEKGVNDAQRRFLRKKAGKSVLFHVKHEKTTKNTIFSRYLTKKCYTVI